MRRWDRLVDAYIKEYRDRGTCEATVAHTASRLGRWGRWMKSRRPKPAIEAIDAELITRYLEHRAHFRAKSTVHGTLSTMRGFGDYLVREGYWRQNPLRWMKGPKVTGHLRESTPMADRRCRRGPCALSSIRLRWNIWHFRLYAQIP